MSAPKFHTLHETLACELFTKPLSDADAFLLFCLLHTYTIVLEPGILEDDAGRTELHGLTARGAAEVLAALSTKHGQRSDYEVWHHRFWSDWGAYERLNGLSAAEKERLASMKARVEGHPFVVRLEVEPGEHDPAE